MIEKESAEAIMPDRCVLVVLNVIVAEHHSSGVLWSAFGIGAKVDSLIAFILSSHVEFTISD